VLSIVSSPLWLCTACSLVIDCPPAMTSSPSTVGLMVAWLVANAVTYVSGLLLRRCTTDSADAFLNWFTVPFLLLYCLLFATLGVYINSYAFDALDTPSLTATALVPAFGYLAACTACAATRLDDRECRRTACAETSMFNSMIALVTIRFTLSVPEADLASAVPMWITFTSLVTVIVSALVTTVIARVRKRYFSRRKRERIKSRFSVISSTMSNRLSDDPDVGQGHGFWTARRQRCETPSEDLDPVVTDDQTVSLL